MADNHDHELSGSDEEFDWEEVQVPEEQHLEITLHSRPQANAATTKKKGISHAERIERIQCHKLHTLALLGNARVRNQWINDPLLHARLLSLTPLPLQTAFALIHKSRITDQNLRGRMFETAITNLVEWWANEFFRVTFHGHIRNRTFDEVQKALEPFIESDLDTETLEDILQSEGEPIRSSKSLMKHALMQSGSRDISAQLFTALCRGLGIPARLVVSIQSVPWQSGVGKPKPRYERKTKGKGKEKSKANGDQEHSAQHSAGETDDEMEEVDISQSRQDSPSASSDIKGKGKAKSDAFNGPGQRLDGTPVPEKSEKAKGKEKAKPVIKLRKTKSKGNVLGTRNSPSIDTTKTPPVFWTEVFSRPDGRWLPVDPIRCIVNKRKVFDPTPSSSGPTPQHTSKLFAQTAVKRAAPPKTINQENRLVYVLGIEEDGFIRDVTRRYAREFSAKVAKVQGGNMTGQGGKGRQAWWDHVMSIVRRPYRLHRDDVEDEELETAQMTEGMPNTISGFKDHPLYVLSRHLKQNQTIYPATTPEIGKFRGESVFPRSSVVNLKTAENWMRREGRVIKEGSQPLKMVKFRAGTVNRMRELEVLKDGLKEAGNSAPVPGPNGEKVDGEVMQGLYARNQTELYIPDPIVDGKVPKNDFGNIDLYVPSMLPRGGVHVPFKGVAKIAKKLGFDYAEAVTGFEFKKRRAFPVVEGVVVAAENEATLLEAYWKSEQEAAEKARIKREERVIKRWTRLVQGLRIRQRLQDQYATKPSTSTAPAMSGRDQNLGTTLTMKKPTGENNPDGTVTEETEASSATRTIETSKASGSGSGGGGGGGFLVEADDIVQAFHLPKYQHVNLPIPSATLNRPRSRSPINRRSGGDQGKSTEDQRTEGPIRFELETMDLDPEHDADIEMQEDPLSANVALLQNGTLRGTPKTMRELAEEAAIRSSGGVSAAATPPTSAIPTGEFVQMDKNITNPSLPAIDVGVGVNGNLSARAMDQGGEVGAQSTPSAAAKIGPRLRTRSGNAPASAASSTRVKSERIRGKAKVPASSALSARATAAATRRKAAKAGNRRGGKAGVASASASRKRARQESEDEDDEAHYDSDSEGDGGGDDDLDEQDGDDFEDDGRYGHRGSVTHRDKGDEKEEREDPPTTADEDEVISPSPSKRSRKTRSSAASMAPVPASTRTLRPRAAKTKTGG